MRRCCRRSICVSQLSTNTCAYPRRLSWFLLFSHTCFFFFISISASSAYLRQVPSLSISGIHHSEGSQMDSVAMEFRVKMGGVRLFCCILGLVEWNDGIRMGWEELMGQRSLSRAFLLFSFPFVVLSPFPQPLHVLSTSDCHLDIQFLFTSRNSQLIISLHSNF